MSDIVKPPIRRGWLKKLSRTGVMKNWRSRYVVLDGGLLTYFEKKMTREIPPYGEVRKGDIFLKEASVSDIRKDAQNRIYITCCNEADILFEAELVDDARDWVRCIRSHIDYANRSNSIRNNQSRSITKYVNKQFCRIIDIYPPM